MDILKIMAAVALIFSVDAAIGSPSKSNDENSVTFEANVAKGSEFTYKLPDGLTFALQGKGPWSITIHNDKFPTYDLIYPLNPPYRFSNHLSIGEGYDESARDSVKNTPRKFHFLYRPEDASQVGGLLDSILWPKLDEERETALNTLNGLPAGQGTVEIDKAKFRKQSVEGIKFNETIESVRVKVQLKWPKANAIQKSESDKTLRKEI